MNVCGFFLTLFAALALTESEALLPLTSFSQATLTATPDDTIEPITIHLGLSSAFLNNPNSFGEQMIRYDQLCELTDAGLDRYMDVENCGQCESITEQLFIAMVVAVVAFIPTIATDILRMYSAFDVNCQKVWATIISCITLAGFLLTYIQFKYTCLDSFHDGSFSFARTGAMVEAGSPWEAVVVSFDWRVGNGMICLFAGFALKLIDVICNCIIPTPNITRDPKLQQEYEELAMEYGSDDDSSKSSDDDFQDD